jgi:hypothetical protein
MELSVTAYMRRFTKKECHNMASDELIKNFSEAAAPANSFASATESNFSTYPAEQVTGESAFPFSGLSTTEYRQPVSNLPMSVDQSTLLKENKPRWYNIGPTDSEGK